MLTQEQITELKNQLKSQVQHLPENQKSEAISQINSMSSEALETMVEQQKAQNSKPIFRMIVNGEVDSVKVSENSQALAVLSITPISKGHILIIPKSPIKEQNEIPKPAFALAKTLSNKITKNLKAIGVLTETQNQFGELILNLIPIYDKSLSMDSPRGQANLEELNKIKDQLNPIIIKKKVKRIKVKKVDKGEPVKLNRRIP